MSGSRIKVLHWLLAKTVRTHSVPPESDLLGVAYDHAIPAGTTFPKTRGQVVMFLRLAAREAGLTEFLVQVHYRRLRNVWDRTNVFFDPGRPFHFPSDRTVVYTDRLQLPFVTLPGYGLYAVTIYFRPVKSEADADDETGSARRRPWDPGEPGWVFGKVDYFRVVKP